MSYPPLEAVVQRYYELFNRRALDEAERLVSAQAVFHYPHKERAIGRKGYRELARMWLEAFPDAAIEVRSVTLEEKSTVRVELLGRGTHKGTLAFGSTLALPPTGRRAELPFTERLEVIEGSVTNAWLSFDLAEMLRRLS